MFSAPTIPKDESDSSQSGQITLHIGVQVFRLVVYIDTDIDQDFLQKKSGSYDSYDGTSGGNSAAGASANVIC